MPFVAFLGNWRHCVEIILLVNSSKGIPQKDSDAVHFQQVAIVN